MLIEITSRVLSKKINPLILCLPTIAFSTTKREIEDFCEMYQNLKYHFGSIRGLKM